MQIDSTTNQFYFETIVLENLIRIAKNQPHKNETIVTIFNKNC